MTATRGAIRHRTFLELAILAMLTTGFLYLFPQRGTAVNIGLALLAMGMIALNRGYTTEVVWGSFPPQEGLAERRRGSIRATGLFTLACVLLLALAGAHQGGVQALLTPALLWTLPAYIAWGLLQQYLFQFYLLGRLLLLMPPSIAVALTGSAYSLVHVHDPVTLLACLPAGVVWTALYYRYRILVPLGFSHGILGTCFYLWVRQRDLLGDWLGL
jgi:hypothetical protein